VNITVPGKECETYNFVVKTPPCLQLVKKWLMVGIKIKTQCWQQRGNSF
jgi:hypothetical protein